MGVGVCVNTKVNRILLFFPSSLFPASLLTYSFILFKYLSQKNTLSENSSSFLLNITQKPVEIAPGPPKTLIPYLQVTNNLVIMC